MQIGLFHGIPVKVDGGKMSDEEVTATIGMFRQKYPDRIFREFNFQVDGDYLNVDYKYDSKPIERIRRVTGYLVGTLDRFNDAKLAEVKDRVKHL